MGFLDDLTNLSDTAVDGKAPPTTKLVDWFHTRVSASRDTDLHHPLGNSAGTASPGTHDHDGKNSQPLWDDTAVPADLAGGATLAQVITAVNSILALMREKAG